MPYPSPIWAGILAFTAFFGDLSVSGTLLPFFVDEVLGVSRQWVGIAISVQYAFATVGLVTTGYLADAIGLRRTLILVCAANVLLLNLVGWVRSVGTLLLVRASLGFACTYALGLSWVATIAPRARLARWMSFAVCGAQGAVLAAALLAGALRGHQLWIAASAVSIPCAFVAIYLLGAREAEGTRPARAAAPAVAGPGSHGSQRDSLRRVLRTRYFWVVAFCPMVQGSYIAAIFQTLMPLVLKASHGWREADVARAFQIGREAISRDEP